MLVIVSGPSGVGKNHLIWVAVERLGFRMIVPYTSRTRRPDEVDGVHYNYVTRSAFRSLIQEHRLFEWDYVIRNYYGCPHEVEEASIGREPCIIHALARMAIRIKHRLPRTATLFLHPDSIETLESRLLKRTRNKDERFLRREHWHEELEHSDMFDSIEMGGENLDDGRIVDILREISTPDGGTADTKPSSGV